MKTALLHPENHLVSIGVGARPGCNHGVLRIFTLVFASDCGDVLRHHDALIRRRGAIIRRRLELLARIAAPLRHKHSRIQLAIRSVIYPVCQVLRRHIIQTHPLLVDIRGGSPPLAL